MLLDSDKLRIKHMTDAVSMISRHVEHTTFEELREDWPLQFLLRGNLQIIGEAAARMSQHAKNSFPEIPWRTLIAMRNILVHEYHRVEIEILWRSATAELPALAPQLLRMLEALPKAPEER